MAVCIGVIVAGVDCGEAVVLDMIHAGAEDVASVVGSDFDAVDNDGLKETNAGDFGAGCLDFGDAETIKLLLFFTL